VVSRKKLRVKNNCFPYAVCKLHRVQRRRGKEKTEERSGSKRKKKNKYIKKTNRVKEWGR